MPHNDSALDVVDDGRQLGGDEKSEDANPALSIAVPDGGLRAWLTVLGGYVYGILGTRFFLTCIP
jgi:hypothetical protein